MIMRDLHMRAHLVMQRHIRRLDNKRSKKNLYKRVKPDGRGLYGRPFVEKGSVYKKLVADGTQIRRLQTKKGDPTKYRHALISLMNPCHQKCGKKYCMYCRLKKNGDRIPDQTPYAIRYILQKASNTKWDMFAGENNLAPTKMILKELAKDIPFMLILSNMTILRIPPMMILPPMAIGAGIMLRASHNRATAIMTNNRAIVVNQTEKPHIHLILIVMIKKAIRSLFRP